MHGSDDGALIIVCHVGTDRKTEDGVGLQFADRKVAGTDTEGSVCRLEERRNWIVDLGAHPGCGEPLLKVIATMLSYDEEVPGRCRRRGLGRKQEIEMTQALYVAGRLFTAS